MEDKKMAEAKEVSTKERIAYPVFFLGQNIYYFLTYLFLNTYFTDVGIPSALVAIIVLIVKIFDAVNDPLFGTIVDRCHFKGGKFVPWFRVGIPVALVANILLFAIPINISTGAKFAWGCLAYALWSIGYTMNDIPIFGAITVVTHNQSERTSLNASGRIAAMAAAAICSVVIPVFRNAIGGWTVTVVLLSVIGGVLMYPIGFILKERIPRQDNEKSATLGDMFRYVIHNKYLLIYYLAFIILGCGQIATLWSIYIARYCVGNEAVAGATSLISYVPGIIFGFFIPAMVKKWDKMQLFRVSLLLCVIGTAIKWILGYHSVALYIVGSCISFLPYGILNGLFYMFTPDCAEYGQYMTGTSHSGITFSIQTFSAKLQNALLSAFAAAVLGAIGFVSGENAVQPANVPSMLWHLSNVIGIAGYLIAFVILIFYKLNDHDVQLMIQVNSGKMAKEEAAKQMKAKY